MLLLALWLVLTILSTALVGIAIGRRLLKPQTNSYLSALVGIGGLQLTLWVASLLLGGGVVSGLLVLFVVALGFGALALTIWTSLRGHGAGVSPAPAMPTFASTAA